MKKSKILLSFLIALFAISFTSCKKDDVKPKQESLIVITDNPPAEIWENNSNYGVTYRAFVRSEDITTDKIIDRGVICTTNEGPYGQITTLCQHYQTIKCPKYWGIFNNKIYISESKVDIIVNDGNFTRIEDAIRRKKSVLIDYCVGCNSGTYPGYGYEFGGIEP